MEDQKFNVAESDENAAGHVKECSPSPELTEPQFQSTPKSDQIDKSKPITTKSKGLFRPFEDHRTTPPCEPDRWNHIDPVFNRSTHLQAGVLPTAYQSNPALYGIESFLQNGSVQQGQASFLRDSVLQNTHGSINPDQYNFTRSSDYSYLSRSEVPSQFYKTSGVFCDDASPTAPHPPISSILGGKMVNNLGTSNTAFTSFRPAGNEGKMISRQLSESLQSVESAEEISRNQTPGSESEEEREERSEERASSTRSSQQHEGHHGCSQHNRSSSPDDSNHRRYRTAFSKEQLSTLEKEYKSENYLSRQRRCELSSQLGLTEGTIKIWFQNRRMKDKRARMTFPWALMMPDQRLLPLLINPAACLPGTSPAVPQYPYQHLGTNGTIPFLANPAAFQTGLPTVLPINPGYPVLPTLPGTYHSDPTRIPSHQASIPDIYSGRSHPGEGYSTNYGQNSYSLNHLQGHSQDSTTLHRQLATSDEYNVLSKYQQQNSQVYSRNSTSPSVNPLLRVKEEYEEY